MSDAVSYGPLVHKSPLIRVIKILVLRGAGYELEAEYTGIRNINDQ